MSEQMAMIVTDFTLGCLGGAAPEIGIFVDALRYTFLRPVKGPRHDP